MGATTGLESYADYATPISNPLKIAALLALIPNPDAAHGTGAAANADAATPGAGNLDEMSPGAAAQLRVELAALSASIEEGEGEGFADGSYTAIAGDASANEITIDTGLDTDVALDTVIFDITRGGASVKADATFTDNDDGTFTIGEDSTYDVTAGDVVTWYAKVA